MTVLVRILCFQSMSEHYIIPCMYIHVYLHTLYTISVFILVEMSSYVSIEDMYMQHVELYIQCSISNVDYKVFRFLSLKTSKCSSCVFFIKIVFFPLVFDSTFYILLCKKMYAYRNFFDMTTQYIHTIQKVYCIYTYTANIFESDLQGYPVHINVFQNI